MLGLVDHVIRVCLSGGLYGIVQRYIDKSSYTPGVHGELVPMGYMDMCSLLRCSVMYCFSAIRIENFTETQRRGQSAFVATLCDRTTGSSFNSDEVSLISLQELTS